MTVFDSDGRPLLRTDSQPGWDRWNTTMDDITNAAEWPGVNWPMVVESKPHSDKDEVDGIVREIVGGPDPGACGDFHIGHGGFCNDLNDPSSGDTGYWCSQNPPRGQCYTPGDESSRGCTQTHMAPDGLKYTDALLPHAKSYANVKGAVVQAWYEALPRSVPPVPRIRPLRC